MNQQASPAAEFVFRDIEVGQTYRLERTFTADDVRAFATLSGDFSPLHVDPAYAASTEFGGCVVHGMLLAALFSQLIGMRIPGKHALYLGHDLVFRRPVLVGQTVTASAKVAGKNEATRTLFLTTEIHSAEGKIAVSGSARVKVRDGEPAARSAEVAKPAQAYGRGRRVALVTGASRGIGAEIAKTLARQGVDVVVNYFRSADSANRVIQEICSDGGTAVALPADVREADDVQRLMDAVATRFGRLDHVVNGAVGELRQERFVDLNWSSFQSHLDYQLKGAVHVCQTAYPLLKQVGGGAIVNILSQTINGAPPTLMADYVAAKHALYGLSKALAVEWASDLIRVNTVSPGLTQTDLTQHYHDRVFKAEAAHTPLKRLARPVDIARTVAFLLSEDADFLTGIDVSVSGGQSIG